MRKALAELRAVADADGRPLTIALRKRLRREWPELANAIRDVLKAAE